MINQFTANFLHGESIRITNINEMNESYYDLAIYCSSWDKRSVAITGTDKIKSNYSLAILFEKIDPFGIRAKNDSIIIEHAKKNSCILSIVREKSISIDILGKQIEDNILCICKKLKKNLKIFVDISSLPRFYVGLIMGYSFKNELVSSITLFYAEGKYNNQGNNIDNYEFTTGKWKAVKIPTLEGKNDPYKKKFAMVSVGFEGNKTLQMIDGVDPDRIALLFPDPGYTKEYTGTTYRVNKNLIVEYNISKENIIKAHAGDAIGAWKELHENRLERPEEENTFYICCGTKPHSLALILNSISKQYPTVMYRLPDGHPFSDIEQNGVYWVYKIQDLSASPVG